MVDLTPTPTDRIKTWGDWASWEVCPGDSFVISLQTKIHPPQAPGVDDTALNAIRLRCNDESGTQITSGQAKWGEWHEEFGNCMNGFFGAKIILESWEVRLLFFILYRV